LAHGRVRINLTYLCMQDGLGHILGDF
jgi:hypothetical protein